MVQHLKWPIESSNENLNESFRWQQPGSNQCLDFHGDPLTAKLVVYSDGNHHMALEACCQKFKQTSPEIENIFYATTPPRVILQSVLQGGLLLGNLQLNILPHVFISPPNILDQLVTKNMMSSHQPFAKSHCNVLLVKKGNPKNINTVADLLRDDVRLTLSNPVTESASYEVYKQTLLNIGQEQNCDVTALENLISLNSKQTVFGETIHHREVPQTIFANNADVAMVYYHLALRYTRIFPDEFELVELQDKKDSNANIQSDYHIGLINEGGQWGQRFVAFMLSDIAADLYGQHGLHHYNKKMPLSSGI